MYSKKIYSRNEYIDWLKGFAIILVVLGHCWTLDRGLFWLIYRFHMPLFFCISGYLFNNKRNFKDFLKIKLKTLIIPYMIFFLISFFITYFLITPISIKDVLKAFIFNGKYLTTINNWAIWYLPLFFIQSIIFYFITKITNNKVFCIIILIFSLLTVPTYKFITLYTSNNFIPFSIQVLPAATFFMGIGQLFKRFKEKFLNINRTGLSLFSFALFIIGILLSLNNSNQIISISTYNYVFSALFIIPFIIIITQNNNNKVITYLGKNSLIILGLHRIILKIMEVYKLGEFLKEYNITGSLSALLITILCIAIVCLINTMYKFIINNYKKIFKINSVNGEHINF